MRRGTVALALAFGLGVAGLVAADEPATGNWFTRTFPLPWAKAPVDAEKNKTDELPPGPSVRERQAKADAALARRREVCDRLREIAFEIGDKSLSDQADELDQRAWDVHVTVTNRIAVPDVPSVEPDNKKKGGRK